MAFVVDNLRKALGRGPAALLIRHAHREPITDPTKGHDVPLTDEGRRAAGRLGDEIGTLLGKTEQGVVGHSPVPRCEDTASAICRGLASIASLGPLSVLGGPYLNDPIAALTMARDSGFVRRWFDGLVPVEIVQPLHLAARVQVQGALKALGSSRLGIFVTHDWNVMLVREHYFAIRHEQVGWPDYLDGVVISSRSNGLSLLYGDRSVDLGGDNER